MDVLLIEDDGFKEEAVSTLIRASYPTATIEVEKSVQTAVENSSSKVRDLIILDIALPSHDRSKGPGNPQSMPSGGVEILLNLNRLRRVDPVIILTQYPELEIWGELVPLKDVMRRFEKMISVNIAGVVHFEQGTIKWKDDLLSKIAGLK